MKIWAEIRRDVMRKEIKWLLVNCVILVAGIADEIFVHLHGPCFYVLDYSSVSLTILSIQATVATLVIAILSLMTNKMDQGCYGMSYNDFLLNIKPRCFKQKRIITIELLLIGASVVTHMLRWYNVVIAIFVISLYLVYISVTEIYEVFSGTESLKDEIREYVLVQGGDSTQKLFDLNKQWKNEADKQSENEYQDYRELFNQLFVSAFRNNNSRKHLLDQCAEIAGVLLNGRSDASRLHGIDFVNNCYLQAGDYIREHKDEVKGTEPFDLLDRVCNELTKAIDDIKNIKEFEYLFQWEWFAELVVGDTVYLQNYRDSVPAENDNDIQSKDKAGADSKGLGIGMSRLPDIQAVKNLCYYLGQYISTAPVRNINRKSWERPLQLLPPRIFSYPQAMIKDVDSILADCYFSFLIAQVQHKNYALLKEQWYKTLRRGNDWSCLGDFAYTAIKLHCYIYYLAYFETTACVDQQTIDQAKDFIEDKTIGVSFRIFLEALDGSHDIFNERLEERLTNDLRAFEFMPDAFEVKWLEMGDVSRDFATYIMCFFCNESQDYDMLKSIIPENKARSFYKRYVGEKQDQRRSDLYRFFRILGINDASVKKDGEVEEQPESDAQLRSQEAYNQLVQIIERQYKLSVLHEAETMKKFTQEEYSDQKAKAIQKISEFLNERFSGLIDPITVDKAVEESRAQNSSKAEYREIPIFRFSAISDMDIEKIICETLDRVFIRLSNTLAEILDNARWVSKVDKQHLGDKEWLKYIESHKDSEVIGSEFTLRTKDHCKRQEVRKWLKGIPHYTNGGRGFALVIKKDSIKINIRNIGIDIRPETLEDINMTDAGEIIKYEPSKNMPVDFTREELSQYLGNKWRIVTVHAEVAVAVNSDEGHKIGDLIYESGR